MTIIGIAGGTGSGLLVAEKSDHDLAHNSLNARDEVSEHKICQINIYFHLR